ncbi:hypothetical protein BZB76_1031 [Actinomadura pelletieri DSM 43383]|uniref:Lipoprotein n=1 Tax=Actinomadura pelletieri DSM 43383 TaxID=1120940 RepID=A0A495QZG8_9ACTN|nr:hypothetical protein [Actinomadura pelletieri]RKS79560.1 hypothetical protein BZB76_1031 [Actinomadura pelletieri DSM 43383]
MVPGATLALVLLSSACLPADDKNTGMAPTKAPASPAAAKPTPTATPNGVEKLKPAQILARARKATASAQYVRMRAELHEEGESYKLDFRYEGKTKAAGTFMQGSQHLEISRFGKTVYLAGNDAYWKEYGGKAVVQLLSGKHLKTTVKDRDFKELAVFSNRMALLNEVLGGISGWKKSRPGKVGTTPSVVMTSSSGDKLHVASQGPPYILLLKGGPGNSIEYLGYETPVGVRPPTKNVVDIDSLRP